VRKFLLTDSGEIMSKRIYVGNLSYQTTENDLNNLFGQVGDVESVNIITDRDTGRSKGFGFVEMGNEDAEKAIAQLNGTELNGRSITVNEARPREGRGGGNRGGFGCSRCGWVGGRRATRWTRPILSPLARKYIQALPATTRMAGSTVHRTIGPRFCPQNGFSTEPFLDHTTLLLSITPLAYLERFFPCAPFLCFRL